MTLKQIFVSSAAAFALSVTSLAPAGQPATPLVSGDEPMNVEDSAQIKAPDPSAAAQAKTAEMLKQESESGVLTGDMPMNVEDSAQIKAPDPSAAAQAKTAEMLKQESESGVLTGDMPMNVEDSAQIKAPK